MARFHRPPADGDPEEVPVRSAATVVIVRDEPRFEVLMVQRTSRVAFGASAWVFPGGRVDPEDANDTDTHLTGLTDAEASKLLDLESGGLAWWIAGVRETVEEAGLLLVDAQSAPTQESIAAVRDAVHKDSGLLVPALREHGLTVDLSLMHEVARFITPIGPPRRFDTRFFLTVAPHGQEVTPDEGEIVAARWVEPGEALELWQVEEFQMMPVTHWILACLGRHESAADVVAHAKRQTDAQRLRVDDPRGQYRVLLPQDDGYETADLKIEHGWVRL